MNLNKQWGTRKRGIVVGGKKIKKITNGGTFSWHSRVMLTFKLRLEIHPQRLIVYYWLK